LFLASRLPAAEDASTLAPGPRLDHNRRVNPARKARADPKPLWIWGVTLGVLGAIAGDLVLLAINLTSPRAGLSGLQGDVRIVLPLHAATFIVLGALVASRLPKNPVGWILWAGGLGTTVQLLMTEYAWTALRTGPLPGAAAVGSLANGLGPAGFFIILTFLVMLFPNGHLPSPRWRPAAVISGLILALCLTLSIVASLSWGDFRKPPPISIAIAIGIGLTLVPIATAIISLVVRYRRSNNEQRQQIKWLAYAAVVIVVCNLAIVPLSVLLPMPAPNSALTSLVSAIPSGSALLLPIAMAIAILRYRLYDIDLVINRTFVYGVLAVAITLIYIAIVVGVGSLIGGGGRVSFVLSLAATALVAVAFQPIRQRAQQLANRLVYGPRATPYEVLSRFSERVAQTIASEDTLQQMAAVLAEGTHAGRAQVWLRSGAFVRCAAEHPTANAPQPVPVSGDDLPKLPGVDAAVPVRHQNELLGALAVEKRKGESLAPIEEKLMADLARQAGLALKNVGLAADLQRRLEELRASRERLVTAQDAERRRLERNIHDGAQQNLVALKVKLGLARQLLQKDPARVSDLIGQLEADTDETLSTLRDLARGIYPPLLADQGLVVALQAQARHSPIPVNLSTDGTGRYRADLEAATYFCCLEALQNAAKYSQASEVRIELSQEDGFLIFVVEDNGRGYDAGQIKPGSGLQNMVDRVEALGGKLQISSSIGGGTRVVGRLPALPAAT
jgi:signal transduction histidine kinase